MSFAKNESGQAMISMTFLMGVAALGFLGLALDAGMLFRSHVSAQTAADAVAVAAANEVVLGNSANEQSVANAVAKLNGFDTTLSTNPASVSLSTSTTLNGVSSTYVTATVSRPIKTSFLGTFNHALSTVNVSSQATAGGATSVSTCVCLTGTSGNDLNLNNASQIQAPSCGVVEDSNSSSAVEITQGALLNALSFGTVSSTWNTAANIWGGGSVSNTTTVVQGISTGCSATLPAAPTYGSCLADPGGTSSSFTAGPSSASGVICYNGLTVGANGTADTLNPGTYVISNGYLHFESGSGGKSNLGGNGVFFYLKGNASLLIDNGANVNLVAGGATESGGSTAPTVGIYNGILFVQEAADTSGMTSAGGSLTYINGAMLMPSAAMTLNNGSGSTIKGEVVAQSLLMAGGATLNASSIVNEGSSTIASPKLVQ